MAYFNYTNFCSNSTSGEYDGCLSQAPVPDQVDFYAPETSTNDWIESDQQYYDDVTRWPTSLFPEANLESTSYETQTQGYDQWVYPEHYWPTTQEDAQPTYTTQQYAWSDHTTQQYAWHDYITPSQALAPEQVDVYAPETSTNDWIESDQQYYDDVAHWPTSLFPGANLELTSYETQTQGYDQWVYPEHYWPTTQEGAQPTCTTQQHAWSDHTTQQCVWLGDIAPNYDASAHTVTLEASELLPAPSNSEPSQSRIDWEDNQSGHITDAPYVTRSTKKRRHQPYAPPRAHPNDHTNAEAEGTSETTADAENQLTGTEEAAAPAERPRGAGTSRPARGRYIEQVKRLCNWANRWGNFPKYPSHRVALALALETIQTLHLVPVSDKPSLDTRGDSQKKGKKRNLGAERESTRRKSLRELYEELSRFYELPAKGASWKCPRLLANVLREVEPLPISSATPSA